MGTTITNGLGMVSLDLASFIIQDVSPQRGLAGAGGSVPRRNSRNVNKPVITTASNGLVGKCFILAKKYLGGPEIATGDDQPLVIGKAAGSGNNLLQLDHFQYISNSAQPHPPHLNIMNQTIRSPNHQQ